MSNGSELQHAVEILRSGGVVGLPTETVYGLAADATNELAVRRIFAIKGRPSDHPLIIHVADAQAAHAWVRAWPAEAEALARAFWPGPLTLVLPRSPLAPDAVTGGQDTVAVRVPGHPLARALLSALGGGVAAPSANRFGGVSPTTAAHVRADLGAEVPLVLDGGPCAVGVESTIVDLSSGEPAVLRPGGISPEQLSAVLGRTVPVRQASSVRVSGSLASHYAPRAGVELVSADAVRRRAAALRDAGVKVAGLAPDSVALPAGVGRHFLPDDPAGYARGLYAALRDLDAAGFERILVVEPEGGGVALAVKDRLKRAAAPRPGAGGG
ncbi:MAG: threonylcarbamoyl-AMP synthase [Deltaproteobacteria bacterium]|nr:threonylcarbamoyl-AMP synthase [Deltaproteobacteria bacterium]